MLLLRKRSKVNLHKRQFFTLASKALDVPSASWLKRSRADSTPSWKSVGLSCGPEQRVCMVCFFLNCAPALMAGRCSSLPPDCRGDKTEDAAGGSWFSWNLHQWCWAETWGGTEGQWLTKLPILFPAGECVSGDFYCALTEPASAALGPAETRYRPAVRWTSLLSQHRWREAAAGANCCRWDNSQTGTTTIHLKFTKSA